MPRKNPNRVDDRKRPSHKRKAGILSAQAPRRSADAASAPTHIAQSQPQLPELQDKKRGPGVKAHDGVTGASRLFVALSQMTLASTQQEAITTVTEILTNFIGTEQFACLRFRKDRKQLECLFSMGIDSGRIAALEQASEEMEALLRGETQLGTNGCAGYSFSDLIAVVPLRLKEELLGVIVILTLLPQKNRLEQWDYALCDLLSKHAAASISRDCITTEDM